MVVLIILLALSGLFISIQTGRLQVSGQYKALYESVFKTPEVWQAKDSTWHSKAETVVVSDPKIVQELSGLTEEIEGLKKNMKNFVSYNKIGTETTINKTLLIRDSVFTYTKKYDTITGRIRGDSIDLQGVTHVVLKEVKYWDRKWFLGKKKEWTEIISEDSSTKVIVNRSIKAERKRGLFKNL